MEFVKMANVEIRKAEFRITTAVPSIVCSSCEYGKIFSISIFLILQNLFSKLKNYFISSFYETILLLGKKATLIAMSYNFPIPPPKKFKVSHNKLKIVFLRFLFNYKNLKNTIFFILRPSLIIE